MAPRFVHGYRTVAEAERIFRVFARTYHRDSDGQFASGGGGSGEDDEFADDPYVGEGDDEGTYGLGKDASGVSYTDADVSDETGEYLFSDSYRAKYGPLASNQQVGESHYRLAETEKGNIHIADDSRGTKNREVVQEMTAKQAKSLGDDVYAVNTGAAARTHEATGIRVEPVGGKNAEGYAATKVTWRNGASVSLSADDTFDFQENLNLTG